MEEASDYLFKIVLFGDAGVGKTSLVTRYLTGLFDAQYKITVGVDFHVKKLEVEGKRIALQIWDFAGEAQFRFLLPSYIRGAAGGIFMYDITRKSSLESMPEWLTIIDSSIRKQVDKFPILMIGGKADLNDRREVSKDEAFGTSRVYGIYSFFECSSKDGQNIEKVFVDLSREMMK
jgi:small GTP-binding protein